MKCSRNLDQLKIFSTDDRATEFVISKGEPNDGKLYLETKHNSSSIDAAVLVTPHSNPIICLIILFESCYS